MIAEKREYKGYSLEIHYDEHPDPPDWGMDVVKCYHWHKRYHVMGVPMCNGMTPPDTQAEAEAYVAEEAGPNGLVAALYLYDHGQITVSLKPFSPKFQTTAWDSGQVGVVYMHGDDIQKEWGGDREAAMAFIEGVVKGWADYYEGRVYGYIVHSPEGEAMDSCWGYYGDEGGFDDLYAEMQAQVNYEVEQQEQFHNMC